MEDGHGQTGQSNHPNDTSDMISQSFEMNQETTYIPSKTRNSFSFCISGLPQPPAISGILDIVISKVPCVDSEHWLLPIDAPNQDCEVGKGLGAYNERHPLWCNW